MQCKYTEEKKKTPRDLQMPYVCFAALLGLIFAFICFPSFYHVVSQVFQVFCGLSYV